MFGRYRKPRTEVRKDDKVVASSQNHSALFSYAERFGVRSVTVDVQNGANAKVEIQYNDGAYCQARFCDITWARHVLKQNAANWGARFILRDSSQRHRKKFFRR